MAAPRKSACGNLMEGEPAKTKTKSSTHRGPGAEHYDISDQTDRTISRGPDPHEPVDPLALAVLPPVAEAPRSTRGQPE